MSDAQAERFELSSTQARVLGSLLEKQVTTPDAYPLTLNALTTACSQSSNRDPLVRYETQQVETAVLALKSKGLARVVHPAAGERSTKYRQVADEALGLGPDERAVLCVLLLRGPQTVAELRSRTERLHPFGSTGEVEAALEALAARPVPFAVRVDRQAGQKEDRWLQLLEIDPEGRAAAAAGPVTVGARPNSRVDELEARIAELERRLSALEAELGA
jgi:uncharacterized protein YceH (UPF0502 family)